MAKPIGAFLQPLVANHIHGGREKFPGLKEKQETCNVCKHSLFILIIVMMKLVGRGNGTVFLYARRMSPTKKNWQTLVYE
jgi:hypothetical protein